MSDWNICGFDYKPTDLPDAGEGFCCMGSAVYGPDRCTCWQPIFDLEQAEPVPQDCDLRTEMCHG